MILIPNFAYMIDFMGNNNNECLKFRKENETVIGG